MSLIQQALNSHCSYKVEITMSREETGTRQNTLSICELSPLVWRVSSSAAIFLAGWREKTQPSPGDPLAGSSRSHTASAVNKHTFTHRHIRKYWKHYVKHWHQLRALEQTENCFSRLELSEAINVYLWLRDCLKTLGSLKLELFHEKCVIELNLISKHQLPHTCIAVRLSVQPL